MAYAAYLRVYEPVSAFGEPDRSRWTAYADSPVRPRRRDSLLAEQAEALRRAITTQVARPELRSEHAYVRRADGITYVHSPNSSGRTECPGASGEEAASTCRTVISGYFRLFQDPAWFGDKYRYTNPE